MQSTAVSPAAYIHELPEEWEHTMTQLRDTLLQHLPPGFEEAMTYGMISYVVSHTLYPGGYHLDPKQPLPL